MYKNLGNTNFNILIWSRTTTDIQARNEGGRGLIKIEATHNIQIQNLARNHIRAAVKQVDK